MSLVCIFPACTRVEVIPEMTPAQKEQLKIEESLKLLTQFDFYLKENQALKPSAEVAAYLKELAQTLLAHQEAKKTKVEIRLVRERSGKWISFGLPGYALYLSLDLLKQCKFENEIAALLALQLAHVKQAHFLSQLYRRSLLSPSSSSQSSSANKENSQTPSQEEKDPKPQMDPTHEELLIQTAPIINQLKLNSRLETELFQFDQAQKCSAIDLAIAILYRAGYDPRGLMSLLQIYQKNLLHSPDKKDLLDQLLEKTRREIAMYSPLRNPIINSPTFSLFRSRLEDL